MAFLPTSTDLPVAWLGLWIGGAYGPGTVLAADMFRVLAPGQQNQFPPSPVEAGRHSLTAAYGVARTQPDDGVRRRL